MHYKIFIEWWVVLVLIFHTFHRFTLQMCENFELEAGKLDALRSQSPESQYLRSSTPLIYSQGQTPHNAVYVPGEFEV
jgi:hypothetical protein